MAHPPRSKPPLRSSSGPPNPCITPSTETLVVVVNLMSWSPHRTTAAAPFWIRVASFRQAHLLLNINGVASHRAYSGLRPVLRSRATLIAVQRVWFTKQTCKMNGGHSVRATFNPVGAVADYVCIRRHDRGASRGSRRCPDRRGRELRRQAHRHPSRNRHYLPQRAGAQVQGERQRHLHGTGTGHNQQRCSRALHL